MVIGITSYECKFGEVPRSFVAQLFATGDLRRYAA